MQRLKRTNEGAALPLRADDVLVGRAQRYVAGAWRHVRMCVSAAGIAERSVHCHGQTSLGFQHVEARCTSESLAELRGLLELALHEQGDASPDDAGQAVYWAMSLWHLGQRRSIAVEFRNGRPVGPAAAFLEAWRFIKRLFPAGDDEPDSGWAP